MLEGVPAFPQAHDGCRVPFECGRGRVGRGWREVVAVHHRTDARGQYIAVPADQGAEGVPVLGVCTRLVGQEGDIA